VAKLTMTAAPAVKANVKKAQAKIKELEAFVHLK